MNRATALVAIRVAGYHDDVRAFTRLYIENRVSRAKAGEQYAAGKRARAAGVKCSCHECNQEARQ